MAPLVLLEHVCKHYGPTVSCGVIVLEDIDLGVEAGESLAITGPSGSGKSTLLNIIGTLDRPCSGKVSLLGSELTSLSEDELASLRSKNIGFVFQLHHLLPQCTVWENVLIPTLPAGNGNSEHVRARARRLLDRVGLGARLDYRPGQISGGERQRVAVARALINEPKLLLADEPTGSLDLDSAGKLVNLLLELNREENLTLIVVSHCMELADRMERTLYLRNGKLIESRT